jgi:hypothetical protein
MHGRASLRNDQIPYLRTPASVDAWVVRCKVEIGLATMTYNLKRITNVLGATKLTEAFHQA